MLSFASFSNCSSVFPPNHLDSVRIYIIHVLKPFLITLNFYLLCFMSSLLCSLSPILFWTNSLLLIIHLSFYINHFAHSPSPLPPPPPTARTLFIFFPSILKDFLVLYPFSDRISVTFCRQNVTDGPVRLRQDGSASVFSPTILHYCFNNVCFSFSLHVLKVQFISWCSKHNKNDMLHINFGRSNKRPSTVPRWNSNNPKISFFKND
jgi:hypothetical protein